MKPGIGVGVLVLKEDNVLLGLRNPNKNQKEGELTGQGTWTMPGGRLEYKEKLVDAAIRELKEETNLDANKLQFLSINDDIEEKAHYVTVGFIATNYSGELRVMEPETITEWKWFNIDCLPENIYIPSKKIINNYLDGIIYKED